MKKLTMIATNFRSAIEPVKKVCKFARKYPSMVKLKQPQEDIFMANKKKEVYHVKPLNENKKNIIAALIEEYDIETADDIQ